jgi:arylsulfatase A-like enzyme
MRFSGGILAAGLHLLPTVLADVPNQKLLGLGPQEKKPNIVFVLTDDQDLHMQSLDYMPLIKKHLIDQGTLYKRHYCTTAICCPARVSLWTGKLAHNTNVTDVNPPHGEFVFLARRNETKLTEARRIPQVCQPGAQQRLPAPLAAESRL